MRLFWFSLGSPVSYQRHAQSSCKALNCVSGWCGHMTCPGCISASLLMPHGLVFCTHVNLNRNKQQLTEDGWMFKMKQVIIQNRKPSYKKNQCPSQSKHQRPVKINIKRHKRFVCFQNSKSNMASLLKKQKPYICMSHCCFIFILFIYYVLISSL